MDNGEPGARGTDYLLVELDVDRRLKFAMSTREREVIGAKTYQMVN